MKRTRKLIAVVLLVVLVAISGLTAALATDNSQTYAYLPDHSVYFYDVSDGFAWAHREVDSLALAGVIKGSGDYLFNPENPITRADFIVMLDRAYGMSQALQSGAIASKGTFDDVPQEAYYASAVTAAKAWGIAAGAENNCFQPQAYMTRQDAMVFLERTLDRASIALVDGTLAEFPDADQVAVYARAAVGALVKAQVVGGSDGAIKPTDNVTRAEMAVMLYRVTHLTVQDGSTFYEKRGDVVNVCIGSQVYRDVIIENYDESVQYSDLMRYSKLRQVNGVTYITLAENQPIDRTMVYRQNEILVSQPTEKNPNNTVTYPIAENCVAIDVTHYHKMDALESTGGKYRYSYPSIVDGEVTIIYYVQA